MRILGWYFFITVILRIILSITSEEKAKWRMAGVLVDIPLLIFIVNYLFR